MDAINCPPKPLSDRASWTPNELAALLRKSADWVRSAIKRGELGAIAIPDRRGRVRYVILRHHLTEFEKRHEAAEPPQPPRRQRRPSRLIDYFPD